MRTPAFVSGGLVPAALRGTTSDAVLHISDWYATFCGLAGVDPSDDSPTPPAPFDPDHPARDPYGNVSWPGVDGVDAWAWLTGAVAQPPRLLVLSSAAVLNGSAKLLTAAKSVRGDQNGWRLPNGSWTQPPAGWGCGLSDTPLRRVTRLEPPRPSHGASTRQRHAPSAGRRPCYFDVHADAREENDLAPSRPAEVEALWRALNRSIARTFHSRSPARMLGACEPACAKLVWKLRSGPVCGVPGCS
jgi:hypothetical protein